MPPSESSILRGFLLPPAPLAVALPFDQFKSLFPRSLQSNAQLQHLYRELQHQRAIDIDDVKRNIETEVKKGEQQRREVVRARRQSQESALKQLDQQELLREAQVLSRPPERALNQPHTAETIAPAMSKACSELEAEIEAVEKESQEVLADIKSTIGDLSDLRYGKFNRVSGVSSDLNQEVIQGLARIEDLCHASGQG